MTEGTIFLDKRAHSRFLVKIPVTFKVLDEKHKDQAIREIGDESRDAHSLDTSLGGMYIVSDKALKPNHHLSLKIAMPPPDDSLTILADVVWADAKGAGLRFLAMKEEEVRLLEAFLKRLQGK